MGLDNLMTWVYTIPAVLIAITLHEFAHGFVSWRLGDPTPVQEGRLTFNPLKHLDPLGALCLLVFHMGWAKPVMINPQYYKNQKLGTVLVSLAGPMMNFLIALVSMIAMGVIIRFSGSAMEPSGAMEHVYMFLNYLTVLNVGLGVFNLIPIPPLDGSKVLGAVLPERLYFGYMKYENYFALLLIVLVYLGVLSKPIYMAEDFIINHFTEFVIRLLF